MRSISCEASLNNEMLSERVFIIVAVEGAGLLPFSAFMKSSRILVTEIIPFQQGFFFLLSVA